MNKQIKEKYFKRHKYIFDNSSKKKLCANFKISQIFRKNVRITKIFLFLSLQLKIFYQCY